MRYKLIYTRGRDGNPDIDVHDNVSKEDIPSYAKFSNHQFVLNNDEDDYDVYIDELHPMFNWVRVEDLVISKRELAKQWQNELDAVLLDSIGYYLDEI